MESLRSLFLKWTEFIYSTLDVRCSSVSYLICLAAFQASGDAYVKLFLRVFVAELLELLFDSDGWIKV
jgi:hypothetical protein